MKEKLKKFLEILGWLLPLLQKIVQFFRKTGPVTPTEEETEAETMDQTEENPQDPEPKE